MLVLSRKRGETIRIVSPILENDIIITVVRTGEKIRLGIDAPDGVRILRGELVDDEKPEKGAA